ncbi:MAG: hypothetical protein QOG68_1369 [Solirubrobacteraceae bacterium]|jgi:pimeloyl-ACP methyl ester carboxylesterase|nr:hypothetical protein [Solirubrobacteraceae bacterium]
MEPLVLVPGLLCDDDAWSEQAAALSADREVHVADVTAPESIVAMADAVLAQAPERFALAGCSMGGYVALALMARAPERVTRLALVDTGAGEDTPEQRRRRAATVALARDEGIAAAAMALVPVVFAPAAAEALTPRWLAMAQRLGTEVLARQQDACAARPDRREELAAIACPTLVLHGALDQLTPPPLSFELAALIRGARLEAIDDCGHFAPWEQPATVTAALTRWLAA